MFILIDFPKIQDFQELEGYEDNSYVCVDIDGAAFVSVEWLMSTLSNVEFTQIMKETIKSSMPFDEKDKKYVDSEWSNPMPFEGGMSAMEALIHITNIK